MVFQFLFATEQTVTPIILWVVGEPLPLVGVVGVPELPFWVFFVSVIEYFCLLLIPLAAWVVAGGVSEVRKLWFRICVFLAMTVLLMVLVAYPVSRWRTCLVVGGETTGILQHVHTTWVDWFGALMAQLTKCTFWLGIGFSIRFWTQLEAKQRESVELERTVTQLKHDALCSRVQPHFLFNTLNTVSSLISQNPAAARDAIGCLGSLLRESLDSFERSEIAFWQEYSFLKDYLTIQKFRFRERLQFQLDLDQDIRHITVPALLLQPLVENSVKHGLENSGASHSVSILVEARRSKNHITIRIVDDGFVVNCSTNSDFVERLGIRLTRQRLRFHYGKKAHVEIVPNPQRGFTVQMTIPNKETNGAEVA